MYRGQSGVEAEVKEIRIAIWTMERKRTAKEICPAMIFYCFTKNFIEGKSK